MVQPPKTNSHVIAGVVRSGQEVNPGHSVHVRVVFPINLLPIATVNPYRPQLKHLSNKHHGNETSRPHALMNDTYDTQVYLAPGVWYNTYISGRLYGYI